MHDRYDDGEIVAFPWAEYDDVVNEFMNHIRRDCWYDYGYVPEDAKKLIESEEAIKVATLPQVRATLSCVLRGERFSDGWWGHMIEAGYVRHSNASPLEEDLQGSEDRSRR